MIIATKFKLNELIRLLKMTQEEVKDYVFETLKKFGYKPIYADGFIYAEGKIDIGMVAHMDTVCTKTPKWIHVSGDFVCNSNQRDCLGADDRAGIYGILHLIRDGYRPTVIITEDEEIGCIGASKFAKLGLKNHNLKYLIELDRKGHEDAVFYECDNPEFEDYVTGFGFVKAYGSFTDICEIAPVLGISAVNLSIGYYSQHTAHECLIITDMMRTINRVAKMLDDCPEYEFPWMERVYSNYSSYGMTYSNGLWQQYEDEKWYDQYLKEQTGMVSKKLLVDCYISFWDENIGEDGNIEVIKLDGFEQMFIGSDNEIYHASGEIEEGATIYDDKFDMLDYNAYITWQCNREKV